MKVSRKKTRRFLAQKLYARIYSEVDSEKFHESYFEGILDFDVDEKYLEEMYNLVVEKQEEILHIIKTYAPKFDIETMLKTNIIAMAIAITEMLWLQEEIPAKVSINEGIEISKYYGDDTSKKIVNGILNSFYTDVSKYTDSEIIPSQKYMFFS